MGVKKYDLPRQQAINLYQKKKAHQCISMLSDFILPVMYERPKSGLKSVQGLSSDKITVLGKFIT